ncbi:MAG: hypothetical protein QM820_35140 [Minicystis sp.]
MNKKPIRDVHTANDQKPIAIGMSLDSTGPAGKHCLMSQTSDPAVFVQASQTEATLPAETPVAPPPQHLRVRTNVRAGQNRNTANRLFDT